MIRKSVYIILVLLSLTALYCTSRRNETDSRDIIPREKLTGLLADLYLADGILMTPRIREWYVQADTGSAYTDIFRSYDVTKAQFDKTMRYYFIKKPKKLVRIYDEVLAGLSAMESRYEQEGIDFLNTTSNLWNRPRFFSFPDPAGKDSTSFSLVLPYPGRYELSFILTLFPGDRSVNPRLTAWTSHPDSTLNGKRRYIPTFNYLRDGQPHFYTYEIFEKDYRNLGFSGNLFDYDNNPGENGLHFIINNISLTPKSGQ